MKGYCIAQSHKYLFIWVIKEGFLKGGNSGLDLYIYQHVRKQPKPKTLLTQINYCDNNYS